MPITVDVHASSVIDAAARVAAGVRIGPFCFIGPGVTLEEGVLLDSHVRITGHTTLRNNVHVHAGSVLGGVPQDLKFQPGTTSHLEIGEHTVVREFVTANVGSDEGSTTRVGSHVLVMAYAHIGHNVEIGERAIIAGAVQIAGYVRVDDHAIIGGLVPVHQFCRIGRHAFIGGGYRVNKDVPPFVLAGGEPLRPSSLNRVGLERHGFAPETIQALKQAFRLLFRCGLRTEEALDRIAREVPTCPEIEHLVEFAASSSRGLIR